MMPQKRLLKSQRFDWVDWTPSGCASCVGPALVVVFGGWACCHGEKMDDVRRLLARADCVIYAEKFAEHGYDSAAHLLGMGPSDLETVRQKCGMLSGHMHRLKNVLSQLNYQTHVVYVSDEKESGPASAGGPGGAPSEAHAAATASAATNKTMKLQTEYPTWLAAKLDSYRFSTAAGCKAQVDRAKSCGRRKVIRCSTVLSKKRKAPDEVPRDCPHVLIWHKRKRAGNVWVLNKEKSHPGHTPFCNSVQRATRLELMHDKDVIKHVKTEKKCTGPSIAKQALGGSSGRMDGSVDPVTARRAKNDIMRYHDKDYDQDWSKLEGWKSEYEAKNKDSRCVFQDNPLARGIKMYVSSDSGPIGPNVC